MSVEKFEHFTSHNENEKRKKEENCNESEQWAAIIRWSAFVQLLLDVTNIQIINFGKKKTTKQIDTRGHTKPTKYLSYYHYYYYYFCNFICELAVVVDVVAKQNATLQNQLYLMVGSVYSNIARTLFNNRNDDKVLNNNDNKIVNGSTNKKTTKWRQKNKVVCRSGQ